MLTRVARILESVAIPQLVKNLLAGQETWVGSLGQEEPLEKEMVIYSCIFAWKIPWTEEHPWGCRVRHDQAHTPCHRGMKVGGGDVIQETIQIIFINVQIESTYNNKGKTLIPRQLP